MYVSVLLVFLKAVLKSPMPSRLIAPAPASNQGHIPIPPKVPSHITVTIESTTSSSIPVATISGQQVGTNAVTIHVIVLFWLSAKDLGCLHYVLGSLQQLTPPDAS